MPPDLKADENGDHGSKLVWGSEIGSHIVPTEDATVNGISAIKGFGGQRPLTEKKPFLHIPYLPFLQQWQYYTKDDLIGDITAGVLCGVVVVPQSLAYALLANLPPVYGLYTSLVPPLVYSILGTSRHASIGPVALVSIFVPAVASRIQTIDWGEADWETRVSMANLTAMVLGVILVLIGIFRMGGLVRFISYPVLAGFTTAAAIVIGINQLQHFLGITVPPLPYNYQTAIHVLQNLPSTNAAAFFIGTFTLANLIILSRLRKWFPNLWGISTISSLSTLLAVFFATLLSLTCFTDKDGHSSVRVIGPVPSGVPHFGLPSLTKNVSLTTLTTLTEACVPVSILGYMESFAISRKYATQFSYFLDPNQEAFALGVVNFVGGFFKSYPCSGSFSRSALNAANGSCSPMTNSFMAGFVLLSLIVLAPAFRPIPLPALGAILELALFHLIEIRPFLKAYQKARPDFVVMVTTFFVTELSEVHSAVLVPIPQLEGRYTVRSRSVDVNSRELREIKVIRLVASLFFGNSEDIKESFGRLIDESGHELRAVVVDASGISHIDLSGLEAIESMLAQAEAKGVQLAFVNAKGVFRERLKSGSLWERVGGEKYKAMSVDAVVTSLLAQIRGLNAASPTFFSDVRLSSCTASSNFFSYSSTSRSSFGSPHHRALASVLEEDTPSPQACPPPPLLSSASSSTSSKPVVVVHQPRGGAGQYGSLAHKGSSNVENRYEPIGI